MPESQKIERIPRECFDELRASAVQCPVDKVVYRMYIGSFAVSDEPLPVVLLLCGRVYRRDVQSTKDERYARRDLKCLPLSGCLSVSVARYMSCLVVE